MHMSHLGRKCTIIVVMGSIKCLSSKFLIAAIAPVLIAGLFGCHSHQIQPPKPLSTSRILELAEEGKSPEEIIAEINISKTVYILRAIDLGVGICIN